MFRVNMVYVAAYYAYFLNITFSVGKSLVFVDYAWPYEI